uniref:C-type lectin domain-containing protein n=1 Tax=Neogobius melanostomus TaxID=47308 RepID=A0A8C6UL31_9GOBI
MTKVSLTTFTLIYSTLILFIYYYEYYYFNKGCPEGWTPFGTRCFKFFDSKLTWTNAEKSCQSHGANLASIHSIEENKFIVDLIKKATGENRQTFIGGHDAVQDNLWMWSDGSVWDYANWGKGEPNNAAGKENCLEINFPETLWNDVPQTLTLNYICSKDASLKVTLGDLQCRCIPNNN